MARYVDGFIVPIPAKNVEAYRKVARKAGKVWMEYGALEYVECVADDVKPGKLTSFPQHGQRQGDGRPAHRGDGPENHALRRQAHDLRRLQVDRRILSAAAGTQAATKPS